MDHINILFADLPTTISSFVVSNSDMTYTIILNSKLSHERHLESYIHEISHITNKDYEKNYSVDFIEIMSHEL